MNTNPDRKILDRSRSVQDVDDHFSEQIKLLTELTDYGTLLLVRCHSSSNKQFEDLVILAILFKHILTLIDSIQVLLTNGAVLISQLISRTLFESSIYIEWILKEDTERRAKQYYVGNYLEYRRFDRKFLTEYANDKNIKTQIERASEKLGVDPNSITIEAKKEIESIDKSLSKPLLRDIKVEFDGLKKTKGSVKWYELDNIPNLFELAKKLDLSFDYYLYYNLYSQITHGMVVREHIQINEDSVYLEPIRSIASIKSAFIMVVSTTLRVYQTLLKHYRSSELENLQKKYLNDWETRLKTIKDVMYVETK